MNEPIRVLCVFSTLDRGGAESMCMNLYRNIDRSKVQFDFVKHTHSKGAFEDEIIALGGRIFEAPQYKLYNHIPYCLWWKKHLKDHKEHRIIHGHFFTISPIYFKIARSFMRKTIAHSHIVLDINNISFIGKHVKLRILKKIEKYSDYCFACGREAGEWLFPHRKFKVLNNAIDTKAFIYNENKRNYIREELGIQGKFVLGHVGRFFTQKNHAFLIDIFNQVHKRNPNSVLLLVGDGELRKQIEHKVESLGLKDDVIFTGVRSDIPDLNQAMDVFVFPSLFEGLGIVAVEAQAAGLHTICSDVVPHEVKLTDLVDFVSLNDSAEEWANVILKYNNGYARENTTDIIKQKGYDIHTTAKQLQRFYLKISERSK